MSCCCLTKTYQLSSRFVPTLKPTELVCFGVKPQVDWQSARLKFCYLIVICLQVRIIKRCEKKCQSLEYQFELSMEVGDASDKEASSHDPPKMDLLNNQCLEAISMLLMTTMEDHLKRGPVMAITKRFTWYA